MKGAAFLVVALGGDEVKSLTYCDVVGQKVSSDGLLHGDVTHIDRHYINDASGVVDADYERFDTL